MKIKKIDGKRTIEFDINSEGGIGIASLLGDELSKHEDLIYLTTNQIGRTERAFAMKFNGEIDVFSNPAFLDRQKIIIFREKDLYDNKEYFVPRYTEVSLAFQDPDGNSKGLKFSEMASIAVCQAMDMLNGIKVSDYGLEVLPEFDEATEEEKQEVLAAYVQSIVQGANELDEELSNNEKTKEVWKASKFIDSIAHGETKLEEPEMSNRKKKKLKQFLKKFGKKI